MFPDLECEDFTRMNNHLTGDGDFMITRAERNREQCETACLSLPPQRYCQAYVLTHSSNCSLIGYILFQNDSNVHYRRICRKGTEFITIFCHSKQPHTHKIMRIYNLQGNNSLSIHYWTRGNYAYMESSCKGTKFLAVFIKIAEVHRKFDIELC